MIEITNEAIEYERVFIASQLFEFNEDIFRLFYADINFELIEILYIRLVFRMYHGPLYSIAYDCWVCNHH